MKCILKRNYLCIVVMLFMFQLAGQNSPVVSFTVDPDSSVSYSTLFKFTPTAYDPDGNAVQVSWNFDEGDGWTNFSDPQPIYHQFNFPGKFDVRCKATDYTDPITESSMLILPINEAPIILTFKHDPESGASYGKEFAFFIEATDTESVVLSYEWDLGDGTNYSDTTSEIMHTYNEPGDYNVSCVVYDEFNKYANAATVLTVTNTAPVVEFFNVDPFTGGNSSDIYTFTVRGTDPEGAELTCDWDFDYDGVYEITGDILTDSEVSRLHSGFAKGNPHVKARLVDRYALMTETELDFFVDNSKPTAVLTLNNFEEDTLNIETNDTVTFGYCDSYDIDSDPIVEYKITTDGQIQIGTCPGDLSYVYNTNGIYTVELQVTEQPGLSDIVTKYIEVQAPLIDVVADFIVIGVTGDTLEAATAHTFDATLTQGNNLMYEWMIPYKESWETDYTGITATHYFPQMNGEQMVGLKVTDTVNNITDLKAVCYHIMTIPAPTVETYCDNLKYGCSICYMVSTSGSSDSLYPNYMLKASYSMDSITWTSWTDIHSVNHLYYDTPGVKSVYYRVKNPSGKVGVATVSGLQAGTEPPVAELSVVETDSINYTTESNYFEITAENSTEPFYTSPGTVNYLFDYDGYTDPDDVIYSLADVTYTDHVYHAYSDIGTYTVLMQVTNCSGLTDTATQVVTVDCIGGLKIGGDDNTTNPWIQYTDTLAPAATFNNNSLWLDFSDKVTDCQQDASIEIWDASMSQWSNIWDDPYKGTFATFPNYPYYIHYMVKDGFHDITTGFDLNLRLVNSTDTVEFHNQIFVDTTATSPETIHPYSESTTEYLLDDPTRSFVSPYSVGSYKWRSELELPSNTIQTPYTSINPNDNIHWHIRNPIDEFLYASGKIIHILNKDRWIAVPYITDASSILGNYRLERMTASRTGTNDTLKFNTADPANGTYLNYGGQITTSMIGYDDYNFSYKCQVVHNMHACGDALGPDNSLAAKIGVTADDYGTFDGYRGYIVDLSLLSSALRFNSLSTEGESYYTLINEVGMQTNKMVYTDGWARMSSDRTHLIMNLWEYLNPPKLETIQIACFDGSGASHYNIINVTFDGPPNGYIPPTPPTSYTKDVDVALDFGTHWINPHDLYTYPDGGDIGPIYPQPDSVYGVSNYSHNGIGLCYTPTSDLLFVGSEDPFNGSITISNNTVSLPNCVIAEYGNTLVNISLNLNNSTTSVAKSAIATFEETKFFDNIVTKKFMGTTNVSGFYLIEKQNNELFTGYADEYGEWSNYGDKLKFTPYKGSDFRGVATLDFNGNIYRIVVLPFMRY